jgi:hypothetical protein
LQPQVIPGFEGELLSVHVKARFGLGRYQLREEFLLQKVLQALLNIALVPGVSSAAASDRSGPLSSAI